MTRHLLIDADILAYKSSVVHQGKHDWGGGVTSVSTDPALMKHTAMEWIDNVMSDLDGDKYTICLSDDLDNFRTSVDPSYKQSRTSMERPVELYEIKEWMAETLPTKSAPLLEADDVMGILATKPVSEDRIIVSDDKDMRTVPALVYHPNRPKNGVMQVSELDAIRFHFWQTVVGDVVDGYPGCHGIGPASEYAEDILASHDEEEAWDNVLMAYSAKRLTESEAVVQARLAFILRDGYYPDKAVRLWDPPFEI